MGKGAREHRVHLVWWEDLRPWIEQLYGRFGLQTRVTVDLPADRHQILPAVRLTLHKPAGAWGAEVELTDWRTFNPNETGAAESAALKMISAMLLRLEDEQERSEAEQQSF